MSDTALARTLRHIRLHHIRGFRIRRARRRRLAAPGRFVGVTGSSAKSTTTALIARIMRSQGRVQEQVIENTFNPLLATLMHGDGADFTIVETGGGGPGEMYDMARALAPDLAVVTLIGREHFSRFQSREAVAEEKVKLVEALRPDGLALLNADDPLAMSMAARTSARVQSFGESPDADYRISEVRCSIFSRLSFRLDWAGGTLQIRTAFPARHFALPVAAAAAAGLALGASPDQVTQALAEAGPLQHRFSVHEVPGGPVILADCAKAPRDTLGLAFDALKDSGAPRTRIVLGTISDYSDKRRKVQRMAVEAALQVADQVILKAERSQRGAVLLEAEASGRLVQLATTEDVARYVADTAQPGEVILLKGSRSEHLERVYLHLQSGVNCWEAKCGHKADCLACGLSAYDYRSHRRRRALSWLSARAGIRAPARPTDPPRPAGDRP